LSNPVAYSDHLQKDCLSVLQNRTLTHYGTQQKDRDLSYFSEGTPPGPETPMILLAQNTCKLYGFLAN